MAVTGPHLDPARVAEIAEHLRKGRSGDVALPDVMALAELMVGSMQDFFKALDMSVYSELREIADYIARTKDEIRNLRANDIKENRIPGAGRELDAIVSATEQATNIIMEQAERLMSADKSDKGFGDTVDDAVMQIFEACSFQDLTGQRISKIVSTLDFIDRRISRFSEVIGEQCGEGDLTEEEREAERRTADLMLHGPQDEGVAINQSDVDALIDGNMAAKSAPADDESESGSCQADIDAILNDSGDAGDDSPEADDDPKGDDGSDEGAASQADIDALFD